MIPRWGVGRAEIEDLCDEDGPPSFCPLCEAREALSEVRYYGSDGYLCESPGCEYSWQGPGDDAGISDRERL